MRNIIFKLILTLLVINKLPVQAQNKFNSYSIKDENLKNIFKFEDESNKKNILILKYKETSSFVLFDENYNEEIVFNGENSKENFIGFSFYNETYYAYSQKNKTIIEVEDIDFKNKRKSVTSIILNLEKKERIITAFNKNNRFIVITYIRNCNLLNVYFLKGKNVEKKSIDFSKVRLIDSFNKTTTLSNFIEEQDDIIYRNMFSVINPNSNFSNIINATQKKKIYVLDDKLVLSSDVNSSYSQYIFINLNDFSVLQKSFTKGLDLSAETNSFLINDRIFILKFSNENALITIKNLEDILLKSINISGSLGHDYINSELIEENGSYTDREVIDNKTKFFRRIDGKNPSISGSYKNNQYDLTIAGVSYPQQNTFQLGMFGALGAIIGELISYNSQNSIQSFTDKKVLYFTSTINSEKLLSLNENNPKSGFNELRAFMENKETKDAFLEPFDLNGKLILIGYDKKNNKLNFYKF